MTQVGGQRTCHKSTMQIDQIDNEFLQRYLAYTEETEPPKIMHIWAALSGISACMAKHVWLETGLGQLHPNMYVLLVGPSGLRKSTALKSMGQILMQTANVRFAPDDTAGQRQGLIAAMGEDDDKSQEDTLEEIGSLLDRAGGLYASEALAKLGETTTKLLDVDKHTMYVCASEFGSFLGQNSLDMTRFLTKMWDVEPYNYRLKNSRMNLKDALLNILGCTTPTEISNLLPPEAIGQGFMSRIILVYSPEKYKKVPPSKVKLAVEHLPYLEDVYSHICYNMKGAMSMTSEAEELLDKLYMRDVKINDSRFVFYTERRTTHLMKLSAALAASRKSMQIDADDINQANIILTKTEETMPEALGEYGLSPLAHAKQKMVEFIQHAKGPVTDRVLWFALQRDMKILDYRNSIADLINSNKIIKVDTKNGIAFVYNDLVQQAMEFLAEADDENEADASPMAAVNMTQLAQG